MRLRGLILCYVFFAIVATGANLTVQRLLLSIDRSTVGFGFALAGGSVVGLAIKYALDKRWIFRDTTGGLGVHARKFPLYTATGVLTTLLFWITETAFWLIGRTESLREVGALCGLAVGYAIKYSLDRRLVFPQARPVVGGGR